MKKTATFIYILFSILFLLYLLLSNPSFPNPSPDSLQSNEQADTETPLRRAYFTNYNREEVMEYYKKQLARSKFFNVPLPTYRLNYPPEESQTIIRDQTQSTFLEEIVHPFRESLFVNGFEPKDPKDAIHIGGSPWRQKIIIRYIASNIWVRVLIGLATISLIPIVYKAWYKAFLELKKEVGKRWTYR